MTARCFSLVGASVARVTRLDECGRPQWGDCSQVTTEGFVSITATANVDEGDTIDVKNAGGKRCVYKPGCPSLTGYTVEIAFCQVDPDVMAMTTGQRAVLDPATNESIGFRVSTDVAACDLGWALEAWSEVPGQACGSSGGKTYGYTLFPFLGGGVFGDFTLENDAVTFTVSSATTQDNPGWGYGPYDVTLGEGGVAGPLTEVIAAKDHLHVQLTEVAPPEATCGCTWLEDPEGPVATDVVAGEPGMFTPSASEGSRRPKDMTELSALTPSDATAWTTGQYVELGDGTLAYWDGAAWQEGMAP